MTSITELIERLERASGASKRTRALVKELQSMARIVGAEFIPDERKIRDYDRARASNEGGANE